MISLKPIAPEDAEAAASLSQQLGYPSAPEEIWERIHEILSTNDHLLFAAMDGEKMVGWVHALRLVYLETGAFAEIAGLVVDKAYRGQGIGKLLIDQVRDWCKEKDLHSLQLHTNIIRKEAHLFYERLGFRCNKVQKVYVMKI